MSVKLEITTKGLRDIHGRFVKVTEGMSFTMRQRVQMLMRSLREAVRRETPGGLKRYVGYRTEVLSQRPANVVGRVVLKKAPSPPYPPKIWDYILKGTPPHVILPRNKQALAFYWTKMGRDVVFKSVQHPGTDPNDFPARAWRMVGGSRQVQRTAAQIGLDMVGRLEGR
jgi:hypothetical protein